MNTWDYKTKANQQLLDTNYYQKLDLTPKHQMEINDLIRSMFTKGEISSKTKVITLFLIQREQPDLICCLKSTKSHQQVDP